MESHKKITQTCKSSQSWSHLLEDDSDLDGIDFGHLLEDDSELDGIDFDSAFVSTIERNINDLPIELMVIILKKCRLERHQLMPLRLVCYRWLLLIDVQMFESKRSLKLFVGSREAVKYYSLFVNDFDWEYLKLKPAGQDDDLVVSEKHFTVEFIQFLGKLFPNLQELVIDTRYYKDAFSAYLRYLLTRWPNLTSLTVIHAFTEKDKKYISNMTTAINNLSSLKRLDLSVGNIYEKEFAEQLVPTFGRLEHLSYAIHSSKFLPAFAHLNATTFKCLGLTYLISPVTKSLISINSQLVTNITELCLSSVDNTNEVQIIAKNFVSLKHLSMHFRMYFDTTYFYDNNSRMRDYEIWKDLNYDLLNSVSELKQLVELTIGILDARSMLSQKELNLDSITSFPTVKVLHLFNILIDNSYGADGENDDYYDRDEWDEEEEYDDGVDEFDIALLSERFCQILATAFPNLEKLTIRSKYTIPLIGPYLKFFPNLRLDQCQFSKPYNVYYSDYYLDLLGRHQKWFRQYTYRDMYSFYDILPYF